MGKTNELRKLIKAHLTNQEFVQKHGIKGVYFENADKDKMYPHIVFSFGNINTGDIHRKDYALTVDVFDKSPSAFLVEEITDDIEDMFNALNDPQEKILPTFYLEGRRTVIDEDKTIRHRQIDIIIQNY